MWNRNIGNLRLVYRNGRQICVYGTNGKLIVEPPAAGWVAHISRDADRWTHWVRDVVPHCVCCPNSFSSLSLNAIGKEETSPIDYCRLFHERRPIDSGTKY